MEKSAASQDSGTDTRKEAPSPDRLSLERQHEELERQLAILDRHLSLTPTEQLEQRRLKKEKLRIKDQLHRLSAAVPRGS